MTYLHAGVEVVVALAAISSGGGSVLEGGVVGLAVRDGGFDDGVCDRGRADVFALDRIKLADGGIGGDSGCVLGSSGEGRASCGRGDQESSEEGSGLHLDGRLGRWVTW